MDYKECKFEDIEKLIKGFSCLGDYGWGFTDKSADLIKKIAKEDGWSIFKVVDADKHRTGGHHRDYYFVSDKYKCFVPVDAYFWDHDSFQRYLERAAGKLHKYLVKFTYVSNATGNLTTATELVWSHDKKEAETDGIKWHKSINAGTDYKILKVTEQHD